MLKDVTPPGCTTRIVADSHSYLVTCADYMVIGCMHCGKTRYSAIFTKEGRLPTQFEFMEGWLKKSPRCLCTLGGK